MSDDIPVGVLGVGRIGLFHCERISSTPGLRLAAVSSRAPRQTEEARRRFAVKTYSRHEDLISDGGVRWIVIATTSDQHYSWALAALRAGKNVIIEKPIALSYQEAAEIYQAAAGRGLSVLPHQSRRWDRDFLLVQRAMAEGLLGSVYRIESRRASFSSGWAGWGAQGMDNPWRLKRKFGGGMLNDWAPHLVDQVLMLARSPLASVSAWSGGKVWTDEVDDHFWAELAFRNGLSCRIEASNNHRIPLPRWTVVGTRGTLLVRGEAVDSWQQAELATEFNGVPEVRHYDISGSELTDAFYDAFAEAVRSSKELPITRDQVLAVMETIDLIRQSAAQGRSVTP